MLYARPLKYEPHVGENHADTPGRPANSCGRYRFSSDIFKYAHKALRPRHEHAQTAASRLSTRLWLNRPTADTLRLRERIKGTLFHEQPPQIVPRHMCSDALLHAVVCGAAVRGHAGCRATVRCFAGGFCAPAPRCRSLRPLSCRLTAPPNQLQGPPAHPPARPKVAAYFEAGPYWEFSLLQKEITKALQQRGVGQYIVFPMNFI